MSSIFAAVDAQGQTRFVGDVLSGQACGCFCPSCASPLEAKKGSVRIWHFAHVAMQERPECRAGALNLLRRLALQALASSPSIKIPEHRVTVNDTRPFNPGRQRIYKVIDTQLTPSPHPSVTWADSTDPRNLPPRTHPLGTATLASGRTLEIYIDVHAETPATALIHEVQGSPDAFRLVCWCPPPGVGVITAMESAKAYLLANWKWVWIWFPDLVGRRAAALIEVNARADEAIRELEREELARLRHRQAMFGSTTGEQSLAQLPNLSSNGAPARAKDKAAQQVWSWAPDARPHASFFLYRPDDEGAWLVYQTIAGGFRVLPWPNRWEGWDEFFPPTVATLDEDQMSLMAREFPTVSAYLGRMRYGTMNQSDPSLLPGFPPEL